MLKLLLHVDPGTQVCIQGFLEGSFFQDIEWICIPDSVSLTEDTVPAGVHGFIFSWEDTNAEAWSTQCRKMGLEMLVLIEGAHWPQAAESEVLSPSIFLGKPISRAALIHSLFDLLRRSPAYEQLSDAQKAICLEQWSAPKLMQNLWNEAFPLGRSLHESAFPSKYREYNFPALPEYICPILISVTDWQKLAMGRLDTYFSCALKQSISRCILEFYDGYYVSIHTGFIVVLLTDRRQAEISEINGMCHQIIQEIVQNWNSHLGFFTAGYIPHTQLSSMLKDLIFLAQERLTSQDCIVWFDDKSASVKTPPSAQELASLIGSGQHQSAISLIDDFLQKAVRDETLSGKTIFTFQLDLLQYLGCALENRKLRLSAIFPDRRKFLDSFEAAAKSLIEFRRWLVSIADTVTACIPSPQDGADIVDFAIEYIGAHFQEHLTRTEIAAAAFVSESRLSHAFKEKTGLSLPQYVRRERINCSKTLLLESEKSIKEIAALAGFGTTSYFSRIFQAETGMSPSAYRDFYRG